MRHKKPVYSKGFRAVDAPSSHLDFKGRSWWGLTETQIWLQVALQIKLEILTIQFKWNAPCDWTIFLQNCLLQLCYMLLFVFSASSRRRLSPNIPFIYNLQKPNRFFFFFLTAHCRNMIWQWVKYTNPGFICYGCILTSDDKAGCLTAVKT